MPWIEDDTGQAAGLDELAGRVLSGERIPMPAVCPVCGESDSAHVYIDHSGNPRMGAIWAWCSHCHHYWHACVLPPAWWQNLDTVDRGRLDGLVEYLAPMAAAIDAHWMKLISSYFAPSM